MTYYDQYQANLESTTTVDDLNAEPKTELLPRTVTFFRYDVRLPEYKEPSDFTGSDEYVESFTILATIRLNTGNPYTNVQGHIYTILSRKSYSQIEDWLNEVSDGWTMAKPVVTRVTEEFEFV